MARISVIVPTRDNHRHLGQALASIRAQDFDDLEVIIVDDGSEPPIEELARSCCPEAIVLRQDRAGPSAARNRGLHHASGEMICFLDADDRWAEGALDILLKGFRDAPGADAVQGLVMRFEDPDPASVDQPSDRGLPYAGFNLGAMLVRRDALLEVGRFDERLWHSEDVDLFMRLQDGGLKRLVVPQPVLEYRRHPDSLTSTSSGRQAASNWIRLLHARRTAAGQRRNRTMPGAEAFAPRISVLMAVRDGRKYLPAALDCIRRQTLAPVEIVAVVGASGDGTTDYLQAQEDVRMVMQEGLGLAAARNQALAEARGDLFAFYDHDDLWNARKLEVQSNLLALFARPAASITNFLLVEDADPDDPQSVSDPGRQPPRVGWTPSALLAHRDVFRRVGGFDPDLGMACDTDWFLRLRQSGIGCGLVPQALLHKRVHSANLSASPEQNRAAMFRLLQKHRAEGRRRG